MGCKHQAPLHVLQCLATRAARHSVTVTMTAWASGAPNRYVIPEDESQASGGASTGPVRARQLIHHISLGFIRTSWKWSLVLGRFGPFCSHVVLSRSQLDKMPGRTKGYPYMQIHQFAAFALICRRRQQQEGLLFLGDGLDACQYAPVMDALLIKRDNDVLIWFIIFLCRIQDRCLRRHKEQT